MMRRRFDFAGTWLVAGAASLCLAALVGLFALLIVCGFAPFWPGHVDEVRLRDGRVLLGEQVTADAEAIVLRTTETARIGDGYRRVALAEIASRERPADAVAILLGDGRRLFVRGAGAPDADAVAVLESVQSNALGTFERLGVFARRLGRFVASPPLASNLDGGVLPALIGTVVLVLLMSVIVTPFGVATAVYLHERSGFGVRSVRAAINTLAGVPAIVYGVLGLGLFVHGVGAGVDRLFHADRLPLPTFGGGGLLWAALTLALLTLPVVVVSVEEGLARIPPSLRAGSLALGATREETMWQLLLPAARPAVLTGLILAIARAAGAVAPLMLVGVVKLAPALPLDAAFPYLHPSRQFMHLGFTIYDAALASHDTIRGVPRAYACALLLVGIVFVLNLSAILLRNRLRDRYRALET